MFIRPQQIFFRPHRTFDEVTVFVCDLIVRMCVCVLCLVLICIEYIDREREKDIQKKYIYI